VRWLIVDAGAITSVDYSAARVLRALVDDLSHGGVKVLLVHAEGSLLGNLRRHRLTDMAAPGRAFDTLREALAVIHKTPGKDSV
jgi:MFS superfamily sulfate permease-like transporter